MKPRALLLTAALVLLLPVFAHADDRAQAEALFQQARQLMDAGKYSEACPKLESSQKLDPAEGTLLNLALCYEKNGQTASAWATYMEVAATAGARVDRARLARAHADALAPTLSRLTVQVPNAPPGSHVTLDGKPVVQAMYGVAVPVDPGHHVIEGAAPNRARFHREVDVAGNAAQVSVVVALPVP